MTNLKLAFRRLFKAPFVTSVAILSLALGIGANAAIFSLFNQMLLRPLPVPAPHELVNLQAPGPKPGSQSCNQAGSCEHVFSYAMFRDLQKTHTVFTDIAAHVLFGANLSFHNQTLNGQGVLVSGSYFPVLGLRAAIGRLLTPQDDQKLGESLGHQRRITQRLGHGQSFLVEGRGSGIVTLKTRQRARTAERPNQRARRHALRLLQCPVDPLHPLAVEPAAEP